MITIRIQKFQKEFTIAVYVPCWMVRLAISAALTAVCALQMLQVLLV